MLPNLMQVSYINLTLLFLLRKLISASDDWFVIAITDANFGRYNITAQELKTVMTRNPKVNTALICIGEGAEASWYVFFPDIPSFLNVIFQSF